MIIGLDVGGTHTDVVLLGQEGLVRQIKVPTNPADLFATVLAGLEEITQEIDPGEIKRAVLHDFRGLFPAPGSYFFEKLAMLGIGFRPVLRTVKDDFLNHPYAVQYQFPRLFQKRVFRRFENDRVDLLFGFHDIDFGFLFMDIRENLLQPGDLGGLDLFGSKLHGHNFDRKSHVVDVDEFVDIHDVDRIAALRQPDNEILMLKNA